VTHLANAVGLALAVVLSILLGAAAPKVDAMLPDAPAKGPTTSARVLVDAGGQRVRARPFRRVLSASTASDLLLLELISPDRIVGFTQYGALNSYAAYKLAGKPTVSSIEDLERVLSLKPDLVLVSTPGSLSRVARLREAGIEVFDLGPQRGVSTFVENARDISLLLDAGARGEELASDVVSRLERLRDSVPAANRKSAAYVALYGGKLLSAGAGTSYHDLLSYAGLDDSVARERNGYPELNVEELLRLDPEVVVGPPSTRAGLCRLQGLARLRVCRSRHAIVSIDDALLGETGLGMALAAERIHAGAYGAR
jgi:iron complex transport system substrate-binding protein